MGFRILTPEQLRVRRRWRAAFVALYFVAGALLPLLIGWAGDGVDGASRASITWLLVLAIAAIFRLDESRYDEASKEDIDRLRELSGQFDTVAQFVASVCATQGVITIRDIWRADDIQYEAQQKQSAAQLNQSYRKLCKTVNGSSRVARG